MGKCGVFGCKEQNGGSYEVYRFPKDPKYRNLWMEACQRTDKRVGIDIEGRICAKHFSEYQYKRNLQAELTGKPYKLTRKLKDDAVPDKNLPIALGSLSPRSSSKSKQFDFLCSKIGFFLYYCMYWKFIFLTLKSTS